MKTKLVAFLACALLIAAETSVRAVCWIPWLCNTSTTTTTTSTTTNTYSPVTPTYRNHPYTYPRTGSPVYDRTYYQTYRSTGWKYETALGYDSRITDLQNNLNAKTQQLNQIDSWVTQVERIPGMKQDADHQEERMQTDIQRNETLDTDLDLMPSTLYGIDQEHYNNTVNRLHARHAQTEGATKNWAGFTFSLADGFYVTTSPEPEHEHDVEELKPKMEEAMDDRLEWTEFEKEIPNSVGLTAFRECRDRGGAWGYFSGNGFVAASPDDKACAAQTCLCVSL